MTETAWVRVGVEPLGCGHVGYRVVGGGPAQLSDQEVAKVLRAAAAQVDAERTLDDPVVFGVRTRPRDGEHRVDEVHVEVQVFAGFDEDHRANCGTLTMRHEEARALERVLGSARP